MLKFSGYLNDQFVRFFVRNAASNIVGGMISATYSLLLPAIVVRHLSTAEFSGWSIALQLAISLSFFSLGIQTALATKLAFINESGNKEQTNQLLGGAIFMLLWGVLGALLVVLATWTFYGNIFPEIPAEILGASRMAALVIGISGAVQLFAMMPAGIYQGQHRNIVTMLIQSGVRILTLLGVVTVLWISPSLQNVAIIFAFTSLMQLPIGFFALRFGFTKLKILFASRDRTTTIDLLKYCGSFSVWNISMVMVSGLDIFLVGYYDFAQTGTYALAATLMTVIGGVLSAVLSPLATSFAAQCAYAERRTRFPAILIRATQVVSMFFCFAIITYHFFGAQLLGIWVDQNATFSLNKIVFILLVANAIRLTFLPYATALLGLSLQRKAIKSGFAEGVSNLAVSVYLGSSLGAEGVALGTLVGAIVGVVGHLGWNFSKTELLTPSRSDFILRTILPLWLLIIVMLPIDI